MALLSTIGPDFIIFWMETSCDISNWWKIIYLSTKLTSKINRNRQELRDKINTRELKLLLNKFAVVQIDNASRNVAFICQKRYTQVSEARSE